MVGSYDITSRILRLPVTSSLLNFLPFQCQWDLWIWWAIASMIMFSYMAKGGHPGGSNLIMWTFQKVLDKKENQRDVSTGEIQRVLIDLKAEECGQPQGAERSCQLTSSREVGTPVLQPQGTALCQHLSEPASRVHPRASRRGPILANIWLQSSDTTTRQFSHTVPDFWSLQLMS